MSCFIAEMHQRSPDPLAEFNGSYFYGKGGENGGEERVRNGSVEEWEGLKWVVSEQEKRKGKGKRWRDGRRGLERGFSEV